MFDLRLFYMLPISFVEDCWLFLNNDFITLLSIDLSDLSIVQQENYPLSFQKPFFTLSISSKYILCIWLFLGFKKTA